MNRLFVLGILCASSLAMADGVVKVTVTRTEKTRVLKNGTIVKRIVDRDLQGNLVSSDTRARVGNNVYYNTKSNFPGYGRVAGRVVTHLPSGYSIAQQKVDNPIVGTVGSKGTIYPQDARVFTKLPQLDSRWMNGGRSFKKPTLTDPTP